MQGSARTLRREAQAGRSDQQRNTERMRCLEANIRTRRCGRRGEFERSVLRDDVIAGRRVYLHATKGWRSRRVPFAAMRKPTALGEAIQRLMTERRP